MHRLIDLYTRLRGMPPENVCRIAGAGSNREYYRLTGKTHGDSLIGVVGTSVEENNAFIYLSEHFSRRQLSVPRVPAVSEDRVCYLQTDLGTTSLFDALSKGRNAGGLYDSHEKELLVRVIRQLPNIQIRGAQGIDWQRCYPQPCFDTDNVMFDLNYFKYCFLKPTNLDFHELKLEADFRLLAKDLTAEETDSFMYRDFQARNIMLDSDENPHFIDFQGGRKGPYYYDIASFLWQASAKYPHELRRELVIEYYNSLKDYTETPTVKHFEARLGQFVLFRTLQVLGAYGYRGYFERKQHFIDSIPPAMQNLRDILQQDAFPYPYLIDLLRRLTELPQFKTVEQQKQTCIGAPPTATDNAHKTHTGDGAPSHSKYEGKGQLSVRVYSFSYRKGIPADESGNGGGYVFDCRSTHNPGRYEAYKLLTGLDEPVIRFLEDDGEILTFLNSVYKLADAHVERYMQRGFTDLMFSFGCTGGRHRSVYSAQHLAEHIHNKYDIKVRIIHREQNIIREL